MRGDAVPDEDHVSRLCGGSHVREDGTVSATAFRLRPGENYLSVNWLEHLGLNDRLAEVGEVWRVLGTKRKVGATARLAVLNVGAARASVAQYSHDLRDLSFCHEPEFAAPCLPIRLTRVFTDFSKTIISFRNSSPKLS